MDVCIMRENPAVQLEDLLSGSYAVGQNGSTCSQQANGRAANGTRHKVNGTVSGWCKKRSPASTSLVCSDAPWGKEGRVLVTGGSGYFGYRLGRALASAGFSVVLLDIARPSWDIPDGTVFHQGDIRDYDSLYEVCQDMDCIFHTASYGMSGPEQLKKEQTESVNVGGTNNVINVCLQRGIPRLVYTSTVNVVFTGLPIEEGHEESMPYVPLDMHIDHYSRTKAIAERMVLAANGRSIRGLYFLHLTVVDGDLVEQRGFQAVLQTVAIPGMARGDTGGGLFRTCVLRPSGIYGPEERRHLHRVIRNVERRLFIFSFGNEDSRMNWVHVDNLVMAHMLAADGLTSSKAYVASGQAYFINDGEVVNVFKWMAPLFERLGHRRPLIHLPVSLVYATAVLMEHLHVALRPIVDIPLLFTRNEVRNIAVTHTFKIEKACRDLGFAPCKYSLADSVDQYLRSRPSQSSRKLCVVHPALLLLLGLAALVTCYWLS